MDTSKFAVLANHFLPGGILAGLLHKQSN